LTATVRTISAVCASIATTESGGHGTAADRVGLPLAVGWPDGATDVARPAVGIDAAGAGTGCRNLRSATRA
jgi:hypothetical protein